jgi:type I restriction enzyme S subunit
MTNAAIDTHLADVGLPELPDAWEVVEIESLLSEDRGISVGVMYPGDHDPDGVPLIKVGDLTSNSINPCPEFRITPDKHYEYRRTEFEGGELLVTLVGALGHCAVVPESMKGWNAARAVAVLRLKNPEDAEFIRICLLSPPLQRLMNVWANTSVQATINLKEIKKLPIPLPTTEERQKLVATVSCLDRKIDNLRRQNETLEAIAQTLFKHWFVDFEFPYDFAQGRPNPDGKPYKSSGGEMVPSAIGEIPAGWRIRTLGDVVKVNAESIGKGYPYKEIEYVDISSVGIGILEGTTPYALKQAPSRARRLVKHGDVIWSGVRPNRKSYLFIAHPPENLVVSTGFITLTPDLIPSSYLYSWVTTDAFVEYLTFNASGSAYPAVKAEHFEIAEVLLPDRAIAPKLGCHSASKPNFLGETC